MFCKDCNHFDPAINPDTKRILRSHMGKCIWPVPWPRQWSECYHNYDNSQRPWPTPPSPRPVWPDEGEKCLVFSQKLSSLQKVFKKFEPDE